LRFAMLRNQRSLEQRMYAIVREHRRHMPIASVDGDPINNQVSICKYGYVAEHVVKKVPWSFVHYHMYLSRVIAQQRLSLNRLNEDIRKKHLDNGDKVKPSNLHRIPRLFQVIPQLLPKLRFMTVGSEQLGELLVRMAKSNALHSKDLKQLLELGDGKVTGSSVMHRIKNGFERDITDHAKTTNQVWHRLFRNLPEDFAGTVTTDCIRATWMVEKKTPTVEQTKKPKRKGKGSNSKTSKRQKLNQEGKRVESSTYSDFPWSSREPHLGHCIRHHNEQHHNKEQQPTCYRRRSRPREPCVRGAKKGHRHQINEFFG
jgi:hypothetical protein